ADLLRVLRLGELDFEVLLLGDVDEMQHQAAIAAFHAVEPAEEEDAGLVAWALEADLDRAGRGRTLGRGSALDGALATVVLADKADQRLADQLLRHRAEQFAQSAVRLFQAAETVD